MPRRRRRLCALLLLLISATVSAVSSPNQRQSQTEPSLSNPTPTSVSSWWSSTSPTTGTVTDSSAIVKEGTETQADAVIDQNENQVGRTSVPATRLSTFLPLALDAEDGRRKLEEGRGGLISSGESAAAGAAGESGGAETKDETIEGARAEGIETIVDENPDHYEGDLTEKAALKEKNGEKKEDMSEFVDHILDQLVDAEDNTAGKFNETLEKQEGVEEVVLRVGSQKHHHREAERERGEAVEKGKEKGERKEEADKADTGGGGGGGTEKGGGDGKGAVTGEGGVEEEVKKDLPWLAMLGGGGSKSRNESGRGLGAKSSGELKVLGEQQQQAKMAKEVKQKKEKEEKDKEEALKEESHELPRLIDSNDNEYVISNPGKGSKMQLQEDLTLISDIVKVIVAAALGGLACGLMGQPIILGYLAAGMVVGPGGFSLIHELVQVETLAQFGVVFLLFALGIEFSLAKMQGCQAVALGGGALQIVIAMVVGALCSTTATQGIFIGAFLSMSSTAVVLKCLMDSNMGNTEHGQIMLGTLILQDCALGLLLAVMPALASKDSSAFSISKALLWEVSLLFAFCLVAWLLTLLFIPSFLRVLLRLSKHNSELYQLGCVAVCLCVALLSESMGLSLEVGAFVAGLMLSGSQHSERTLHQVEPIRNIFAALFLASIGMVMNPVFLWQHKEILLASLALVFFGKACLVAVVVIVFGYSAPTAMSVGIALAQIGEFSFVLLSRAQTLRLISHKMYLLLMGTTALSLVLTPFAFKLIPCIVAHQERRKPKRNSSSQENPMGTPPPPLSPRVVMTSRRDPEASMYKRARSKTSASGGGGVGEDGADEELDALVDAYDMYSDEDWRTPKTPSRQAPGGVMNGIIQHAAFPLTNKEVGGESGLVTIKSNLSFEFELFNRGELSEIVVEEAGGCWEHEGRGEVPREATMRRPLGQAVPGRWKGSNEIEVLHHR